MGVGESEAQGEERVNLSEILKEALYFAPLQRVEDVSAVVQCLPKRTVSFNIDSELVYEPFFADFGPLNLACTYRFCWRLQRLLQEADEQDQCVLFCCGADPKKKSNAAVLLGAYLVLFCGAESDAAYSTLSMFEPFLAFRDPTCGISTYRLTVLDCIRAILRANRVGWVDFNSFNLEEYEYFEQVENGDLNWIVPNKLMAFSGPSSKRLEVYGYRTLVPEDYVEYFHRVGVTGVIRLNRKAYNTRRFTDHGLSHYELHFPDGSCPPDRIVRRFLEIVEETSGALAVHCKAGLGRTGALMGCYIMKHYRFTCSETLGYLRIVRPGSVIGPQQHYLKEMQYRMWKAGDLMRHQLAQMNVNSNQTYNTRTTEQAGPAQLLNASGRTHAVPSNKFMSSTVRRFSANPNIRRGSLRDGEEGIGVRYPAAERSPPAERILEVTASPQRLRKRGAGRSGVVTRAIFKGSALQDEASPSPAGCDELSTGLGNNIATGMGRLTVNDPETPSSSAEKSSCASPLRSRDRTIHSSTSSTSVTKQYTGLGGDLGILRNATLRQLQEDRPESRGGSVVVQRVINSAGQPRKVVLPVPELAVSQVGQTAPIMQQQPQQQRRSRLICDSSSAAHLHRYGTLPGRPVMASIADSKWDSAQISPCF